MIIFIIIYDSYLFILHNCIVIIFIKILIDNDKNMDILILMSKAILIPLSPELSARIDNGPLKATGGRGKASWVKRIILAELDKLDGYVDKTKGRRK